MTSNETVPAAAQISQPSTGDTVATVLLSVFLAVLMMCALMLTGLYAMATDPCSTSVPCDFGALRTAYILSLGSLALGPLVGLIGGIRAYRRGLPLFPWPMAAIAIVLVGNALGLQATTLISP